MVSPAPLPLAMVRPRPVQLTIDAYGAIARESILFPRPSPDHAMRSHLAELGIIAAQGCEGVKELLVIVADDATTHLPNDARASLLVLAAQLQALQTTNGALEKRIVVQYRANRQSKRLQTIPGVGPIGASAIAATVTNPEIFRSGRDFADWIGLVPRQMSTGGKPKLGPISKQGHRYLRRILVVGAVSTLRRAKQNPAKFPWVTRFLARRPFKVVAVALANKMARIAWALLIDGETCRTARFAAA
jgi:transposase